ncbi:Hypothetical protein, putative [Bodo saltans]|uniref:Uncharacterized protein n=1 Tax=Bodo saltans TaxID=75058 RepID=A0A0S4IWJ7_BODSA|nr:Hypothetical protein, putative [Bodo saltans]|eukprot:CUG06306.1 Hypothetical protein, putative [Bodo saltans]
MSWDHLNAIGPHCILAEGIGEHSLKLPALLLTEAPPVADAAPNHGGTMLSDNSHPVDGASLDEQRTVDRLHRVRRSIMLFDFRQEDPTSAVDLAVAPAPVVAKSEGVYAAATPNPNFATLKPKTQQNFSSIDYGQELSDLRAPVIPILYLSHALTVSSGSMSWDHLNAIGPHCILAEGIGEHSLKLPALLLTEAPPVADAAPNHGGTMLSDNSHPVDGASLDEQRTVDRLHRVRRSIMLFDFRQEDPTSAVDLAVAPAPVVAKSEGVYGSGQCTVFSATWRRHLSGSSRKDAKTRVLCNLELKEILRRERIAIVNKLEALVRQISSTKHAHPPPAVISVHLSFPSCTCHMHLPCLAGRMSWDHLNAIGPHCILAEGIGEHSLKLPALLLTEAPPVADAAPNHGGTMLSDNSHPVDGASLDEQRTVDRLHRVRRSIMLFDFRQEDPTSAVDLAVAPAPVVAKSEGVYGSGQCTVFSATWRRHLSGSSRKDAKTRVLCNLELKEILRRERIAIVNKLEALVRQISSTKHAALVRQISSTKHAHPPPAAAVRDAQSASKINKGPSSLELELSRARQAVVMRLDHTLDSDDARAIHKRALDNNTFDESLDKHVIALMRRSVTGESDNSQRDERKLSNNKENNTETRK